MADSTIPEALNLFETSRFYVRVGVIESDKEPQYLVLSKATGVVEFCNASFYFARDWARQFTSALEDQDKEIEEQSKEKDAPAIVMEGTGQVN